MMLFLHRALTIFLGTLGFTLLILGFWAAMLDPTWH